LQQVFKSTGFQLMFMLVFDPVSIAPLSNKFPLAQQIFNRLHLQFQLVFKWFSTLVRWQFQQTFNRWFSAGCVGSFSTGFQLVVKQVFN